MLRVTFLGTAASRPTVGRNVSAVLVNRAGHLMLFDCGEGTQRQMMRFGTGFGVREIFFSHLHGDHILGVTGLLRTMALQGREDPISLWAPSGGAATLDQAVHLGVERIPFPVEIMELAPETRLARSGFDVLAFPTKHGAPSLGYALLEHPRLGRFEPVRARELGVPEGHMFGMLHRGEPVEIEGRTISPSEVVGPPRPGRAVVYTGDTRPCRRTVEAATGADLLIHEATFTEDERTRARATFHSTAREAGRVARDAGVRRLVLTHISARYAEDPRALEREARKLFPATTVAYDGLEIEVAFRDSVD